MRFLNNRPTTLLAILFISVFLFQACGNPTGPNYDTVPPPFEYEQADSSYISEDGLQIYIVEEGDGPFELNARDQISLFYTGRKADGEIFESTYTNGVESPGIMEDLSSLIEGFRRGLMGMQEGEKRTIVIPPHLGYENAQRGDRGYELRNDTLIFDIELDEIL